MLNTPTENETKKILEKPTLAEVESFFAENGYAAAEARKFWYYNEGCNWMLTESKPIVQWQPLAHKWMLGAPAATPPNAANDHLHTHPGKDYNQPL